tara:strand:+ start:1296 stop:3515 length:2220 start_codon:yes stop_codon:yes gene_type:complete
MNHYILGIQSYANPDSGACIIKFNRTSKPEYIAISEERLLRKKYPYTFPIHSILYCMEYFNLKKIKDIDFIVSDWIRIKKWNRSAPAYNYQMFDYIKEKLNFDKKKIFQISHHLAHAASTYYTSNFKKSSILIIDGNGSDVETNSYFMGENYKIKFLENYKYLGIGSAYSSVTNHILNFGTGGEGKTMGLAPYGKLNKKIKINFSLKGIETDFAKFMLRMPYSDVLNQINDKFRVNPIRHKVLKANKRNILKKNIYKDWAYAIQNASEKVMIHLGNDIYKKTKCSNVCLAGGVALNCVGNEKLFKSSKFKDIFIFPACSDSGIPFGLALWGYYNIAKEKKKIIFNNAYTGKEYLKKDILLLLNKFHIKYKKVTNKKIAEYISQGKIVGHFNGSSEYGPRALGNRSILADARDPKMRDYINNKIKHREIFRPFAPAILEEKSNDYFDINFSPFMLRVSKCKKKELIPSAIHVDSTARVQTVNPKQNKKFYDIIKQFYILTGVPVVLNTSFNDAGEPLVETPLDAIICFLKTKIDYLIIDNFCIDSSKISVNKKKKLLKDLKNLRIKEISFKEKESLKIITRNFKVSEFKRKVNKENKIAISYVLNRTLKKIKSFFESINHNENILIVGANDHTNVLIKLIGKKNFNKNIDYIEYKFNDIYTSKKKINIFKEIKEIKKINNKKYHKIFISSFQHMNKIKNILQNLKGILFFPYDNSSRSIIDYYFIKKYKGKYPLFSKKLF